MPAGGLDLLIGGTVELPRQLDAVKARPIPGVEIEIHVGLFGFRTQVHPVLNGRVIQAVQAQFLLHVGDGLIQVRVHKRRAQLQLRRCNQLVAVGRLAFARDIHAADEIVQLGGDFQRRAGSIFRCVNRHIGEPAGGVEFLYRVANVVHAQRTACFQR